MDDGIYTVKYKKKTMCGFIKGHTYCIKIDHDLYGYSIEGLDDLGGGESEQTPALRLASETSIHRYFDFVNINGGK